jgi:hypothetical protein
MRTSNSAEQLLATMEEKKAKPIDQLIRDAMSRPEYRPKLMTKRYIPYDPFGNDSASPIPEKGARVEVADWQKTVDEFEDKLLRACDLDRKKEPDLLRNEFEAFRGGSLLAEFYFQPLIRDFQAISDHWSIQKNFASKEEYAFPEMRSAASDALGRVQFGWNDSFLGSYLGQGMMGWIDTHKEGILAYVASVFRQDDKLKKDPAELKKTLAYVYNLMKRLSESLDEFVIAQYAQQAADVLKNLVLKVSSLRAKMILYWLVACLGPHTRWHNFLGMMTRGTGESIRLLLGSEFGRQVAAHFGLWASRRTTPYNLQVLRLLDITPDHPVLQDPTTPKPSDAVSIMEAIGKQTPYMTPEEEKEMQTEEWKLFYNLSQRLPSEQAEIAKLPRIRRDFPERAYLLARLAFVWLRKTRVWFSVEDRPSSATDVPASATSLTQDQKTIASAAVYKPFLIEVNSTFAQVAERLGTNQQKLRQDWNLLLMGFNTVRKSESDSMRQVTKQELDSNQQLPKELTGMISDFLKQGGFAHWQDVWALSRRYR